jgi:hypothetical protein
MKTINYNITAITATNNIAVAMFANKKYAYKTASNNKLALLDMFRTILNKAKDNDELMEKPVLIITTQSILKGFTTGGYIEYLRTGADANGNQFTDEEFALINECAELLARKSFNVRLIDEKMISPKDQVATQIKRDAFSTVQTLAKQVAVKNTKQQMKQQPSKETNSSIALLNSALQQAIREGNIQLASQYTQMIAQLTNPAPQQQPVQDTNEVEVPEDHSELDFSGDEEVDETIDSDEIEI